MKIIKTILILIMVVGVIFLSTKIHWFAHSNTDQKIKLEVDSNRSKIPVDTFIIRHYKK